MTAECTEAGVEQMCTERWTDQPTMTNIHHCNKNKKVFLNTETQIIAKFMNFKIERDLKHTSR